MTANEPGYTVRAAHCDHLTTEDEIHRTLERITAPLDRAWAKLERASRIILKVNAVWPPERVRMHDGRRQELVDETVFRGVLKLLRRRTTASLAVADTTLMPTGERAGEDVTFKPLLAEFGAEYIECNDPPFDWYEVPGGGLMFRRYQLHQCFREADAVVSVATLKSHAFMGVTMCTKNLFGLCPIHPTNRSRSYFHHIIRLPYVLADLGHILQPTLNLVDGLVGQTGREWGGDARVADTLIAGDHALATDLCGAALMGHDPLSDWPEPPFRRDRSHLKVAVDAGYGPASMDEIDFQHDLHPPVAEFDSDATDSRERVYEWRHSMCEQALSFLENRDELVAQYPHEYVYIQDGQVLWHSPDPPAGFSRRDLAGRRQGAAIWLKYMDPDEREEEHFDVYERELDRIDALAVPA